MASFEMKLYPSGFLGNAAVHRVDTLNPIAIRQKLLLDRNATVGTVMGNAEITELWQRYNNGSRNGVLDFDLAEKIMLLALEAFGTETFKDWVEAQEQSPEYNIYHLKWVEETLEFVYQGKPRRIMWPSWELLMQQSGRVDSLMTFPNVQALARQDKPDSILDLVRAWVRRDGGITDLLASLYILFGKRRVSL